MNESRESARFIADFFRARSWIVEYLQQLRNTEEGRRKLKELNDSWHQWGTKSPIEILQEERNGHVH